MKFRYAFLFPFLLILLSCSKDSFINSPDARIRITADTVAFDTVFVSAGSVTQSFKIINENNQRLRLQNVQLMGLNNSSYRININGIPSASVNDLEIGANDSVYVFVQVNIDPTAAAQPFIVRDSIRIDFNGNTRWVQLEAWGQNAHYLRGYELPGNETWTNDLPYVILDYLYVPVNTVLTLEQGVRLYMHANAPIVVDGTMRVNGVVDSIGRVYFQSDRLDEPYSNYPASWPGIYFRPPSEGNQLRYAVIKNAYQALVAEGLPPGPDPKLLLDACVIDNAYDIGIWSRASSVQGINSLISNCGRNLFIEGGGQHRFTHCSFVSYSNNYISHTEPVLRISDNIEGVINPLDASFINNIFWGEGGLVDDEVQVNRSGNSSFIVDFDHNLWKLTNTPGNISSAGIVNNQPPQFDSIDINRRYYDFRLKDNSPALGAGRPSAILTDMDGNSRDANNPDLGAFERP